MARHPIAPAVPIAIVAVHPNAVRMMMTVVDDHDRCRSGGRRCQAAEEDHTAEEKHEMTFHKGEKAYEI